MELKENRWQYVAWLFVLLVEVMKDDVTNMGSGIVICYTVVIVPHFDIVQMGSWQGENGMEKIIVRGCILF